ncbi:hypothetical protein JMK10_02380 [Rhodovulum sulfidophilum]|uniref:hypothetical protein n=1 Tax=Rhodovulum sulfidophilum TaxID=35806 RepID=UPI0019223CAE|nr:hypothetical protein [Rhodovulum sulfidophilum]MBL3575951.1 hypothetical protein [Rhodovulum sulfidophilum]MCE8431869.1 hypothetical protein [Rhodovulum sulfidophilum]MCF4115685.1 hypothetical protein [Rhodovulum sulfidophilum]
MSQNVVDTIEQLENAILAALDLDAAALVRRLRELWGEVISENETLREEALKTSTLNKILKSEVARLKRQIAKSTKTQFGAKSDQNPNKTSYDRSSCVDDQKPRMLKTTPTVIKKTARLAPVNLKQKK